MGNTMNYHGKDGTFYDTWDEKRKADVKWEQQEKQNKLLQEQNNLLKEEQEIERNNLIQQAREKEQQKDYEQINKFIENFIKQCEDVYYPLMEKAGIKNPYEYHKKLRELYGKKPETLKLIDEQSTEIIKDRDMYEYPEEMWDTIKKINLLNNQLAKPQKSKKDIRKSLIMFYLIFSIILGIILSISIGDVIWGIGFAVVIFVFELLLIPFMTKNTEKALENTKKARKNIINSINTDIEKINNSNGLQEWENKVKNFEKKRLENFNYELEIIIRQLSLNEHFIECAMLGYSKLSLNHSKMNFELRFNSYPEDFEEKEKEFWKNKKKKEAEENGTEIFENL